MLEDGGVLLPSSVKRRKSYTVKFQWDTVEMDEQNVVEDGILITSAFTALYITRLMYFSWVKQNNGIPEDQKRTKLGDWFLIETSSLKKKSAWFNAVWIELIYIWIAWRGFACPYIHSQDKGRWAVSSLWWMISPQPWDDHSSLAETSRFEILHRD